MSEHLMNDSEAVVSDDDTYSPRVLGSNLNVDNKKLILHHRCLEVSEVTH